MVGLAGFDRDIHNATFQTQPEDISTKVMMQAEKGNKPLMVL